MVHHHHDSIVRMCRTGGVCLALLGLIAGPNGCGGGGSSLTGTVSAPSASSISDLPAVSTLVGSSSASSSVSAKSVGKAATGTPPLLKAISASNVDTYFWNGLLAAIAKANSATQTQIQGYWQGEGACRMAQTVGYAFQNVLQGGTSLCYMQNMPKSATGVSVTSGTVSSPAAAFKQGAASAVVKVTTSNFSQAGLGESEKGPETIFIKVFGTGTSEGSSGYAADLWFCAAGSVTGYEQLRVSSGTFTSKGVHKEFGNFVGSVSATLTKNASDQLIFDASKDRSAQVYFGPSDGTFTFLGGVTINSAGLLTARNYQKGSFGGPSQTSKHAIFANYSGDTMDALRFSAASFALQDNFGGNPQSLTGATEYQTAYYASVSSGTLLSTAQSEGFSDSIYKGDTSSYTADLNAVSGYDCNATPDIVVAMDFSAPGPQAVAKQCENNFSEMNFCDGSAVNTVRTIVFTSQSQANQGGCSTSFCVVGDDFACQKWADNNIGNSAGITTANAKCSSTGCCTK